MLNMDSPGYGEDNNLSENENILGFMKFIE